MKNRLLFLALCLFFMSGVSAVLISDQGTTVRNSTGSLLTTGNLSIEIYDNETSGTILFNQTYNDTIINGSWNLMINAPLEFGKNYWKDYKINNEDVDFDGNERLQFQSSLGMINNVSHINFSLITNYTNFTNIYAYSLNDTLWSNNYSNFSIGWLYAVNSTGGSDTFIANFTNFTRIYANVTDYNASWSSTTNTSYLLTTNVTYAYSLNDTLWSNNYSNFSIGWLYATNSTGSDSFVANYTNFTRIYANVTDYNASWSSITNASYYLATNPFGFFNTTGNIFTTFNISSGNFTINNQTTYNLFVVNGTNGRVGIGTNTSQNNLNVIGTGNFTTSLFVDNKDLEVGYDYAVNSTGGTDTFIANYTNFTRIYANVTDYNASWSSTTNTSYLLTTNVTYAYSLNDTLWSNNYSNFSIGWLYATNSTGADSFVANYTNFTNVYGNVTDYNASWTSRSNATYFVGSNYATNGSTFTLNYSNFTAIYGYAINDSLWTLNYSTYLTKPTYAQVVNGTDVARVTATNTFGAFNQTFNTSLLFLWAEANRIGVNTTTPVNTFNVVGTGNFTTSLFVDNKDLEVGYDYAVNSTGADSFIANFTNFTRIYANVTDYNASWSSITNTSYLLTTNTTYAYSLNDTLWTNNYSNFTVVYGYAINTSDTDSFIANYTNFTRIYANVTDYNASWSSITNTSYYLATNPFGFFNKTGNAFTTFNVTDGNFTINNQTTYNLFVVNGTNGRVGIGTNTSQNNLNVIGDSNSTGTVYAQNTINLSIGSQYATNGSFIASTNVSIAASNVTYAYSLNNSLWTNNYSNFTVVYGYAINTSDTDSFIANYTNFTRIYANVTDYNASWSSTTNTSYLLTTNVTYAYAINDSLWTLNYSTYLTKPTYAQVVNGTDVARVTATNTFGAFNQTFNTSLLFLWAEANRIGVNTTLPQNTFNVVGDANFTTAAYVNNKNLEVGYDYAVNSTGADSFIANYTNFTRIYANVTDYNASWSSTTNTSYLLTTNVTYAYSLNNTFVGNATAGNNYLTNGTGGAYIYHNGTGWVIKG